MFNKIILIVFSSFLLASTPVFSQNINDILKKIETNNKELKAQKQIFEAKKSELKTGLLPSDPSVGYSNLFGEDKKEYSVSQSFEFPTAYIAKSDVSERSIKQTELFFEAKRKDILLEAKLLCFELVYLNKRKSELSTRYKHSKKISDDFQIRFKTGDVGVLELNKAKLSFLNVKNDILFIEIDLDKVIKNLVQMNGGETLGFGSSVYPTIDLPSNFEFFEEKVQSNLPDIQAKKFEEKILESKLFLSRTGSWPTFNLGFRNVNEGGQRRNGFSVGISIPIFENNNKIATAKAEILANKLEKESYITKRIYEYRALYEKTSRLSVALVEYGAVIKSANNTTQLGKALQLGHISTIEYFTELSFMYSSYDNYLNLEKEYYIALAKLYKYDL